MPASWLAVAAKAKQNPKPKPTLKREPASARRTRRNSLLFGQLDARPDAQRRHPDSCWLSASGGGGGKCFSRPPGRRLGARSGKTRRPVLAALTSQDRLAGSQANKVRAFRLGFTLVQGLSAFCWPLLAGLVVEPASRRATCRANKTTRMPSRRPAKPKSLPFGFGPRAELLKLQSNKCKPSHSRRLSPDIPIGDPGRLVNQRRRRRPAICQLVWPFANRPPVGRNIYIRHEPAALICISN